MNKEFITYIENKLAKGPYAEEEFDRTILSLCKKGMIDVEMLNGEPYFSLSDKGAETAMMEVSLLMSDNIEA